VYLYHVGEYAPDAIKWLAAEIIKSIPSAKLSGILGDPAHTYGYHRARSRLPSTDYSVRLPNDRTGPADAASALDISLNPTWQREVSRRLLTAAKSRSSNLKALREFFGSTDGKRVIGWDLAKNASSTSDDSHLWHVHLSFYRRYANDKAALAPILDVIRGDDVSARDVWTYDPNADGQGGVPNLPGRADSETNKTVTPGFALGQAWKESRTAREQSTQAVKQSADAVAQVAQLRAEVTPILTDISNKLSQLLNPPQV
jgi:hypothetical protein